MLWMDWTRSWLAAGVSLELGQSTAHVVGAAICRLLEALVGYQGIPKGLVVVKLVLIQLSCSRSGSSAVKTLPLRIWAWEMTISYVCSATGRASKRRSSPPSLADRHLSFWMTR